MPRNPFEGAAEIEATIVKLQGLLQKKVANHAKLVAKLKSTDSSHPKLPKMAQQLQEREKDLARTRKKLKGAIAAKRKKVAAGHKFQYGNRKNEIRWRNAFRDMARELHFIDVTLGHGHTVEFRRSDHENVPAALKYDIFISHATEDKEDLARPLAEALIELGLRVWYDEFSLTVGDSLRKSIDFGLANSKFGLVVLSSSFFAKNWTQYELNGLVAREMQGGKTILPIWHRVTKDDVLRYSPALVDKVALHSSLLSIAEIANKIHEAIERGA